MIKILLLLLSSLLVATAAVKDNNNSKEEHPKLRQNVPTGTLWRPRSVVQESLASLKEKLAPEKKTPIVDVRLLPAADLDAMYQNDVMLRHRKLPPDNTPPLCVDIPGDGPRGLCIAYFKQGCFTAPDRRTSCEKIAKNYEKATGGKSLPCTCNGNSDCEGFTCGEGSNPTEFCDTTLGLCVECLTENNCDDGNPCTADSCNSGVCVHDGRLAC